MALFSQNRWLKITVRLALFFRASGSLVSEFTRIQKFEQPLKFYEDFDCFKLYVNDLGLLGAMAQAPASEILVGNSAFSHTKEALQNSLRMHRIKKSLRSLSHVEGWYPELVEGSKPPHLV